MGRLSLIRTPARASIAPSKSVPYGSRAVSRTLVPGHALSVPQTHRRLVSRRPSQFPMAHRPSVPRAQVTETYPRRAPPLRARANCNLKAGPGSRQAEGQYTSVPSRDCPASPASGLHHPCRARARPAALHRATSPPGADPDPGQRLRHRGYEHWPTNGTKLTAALWDTDGPCARGTDYGVLTVCAPGESQRPEHAVPAGFVSRTTRVGRT